MHNIIEKRPNGIDFSELRTAHETINPAIAWDEGYSPYTITIISTLDKDVAIRGIMNTELSFSANASWEAGSVAGGMFDNASEAINKRMSRVDYSLKSYYGSRKVYSGETQLQLPEIQFRVLDDQCNGYPMKVMGMLLSMTMPRVQSKMTLKEFGDKIGNLFEVPDETKVEVPDETKEAVKAVAGGVDGALDGMKTALTNSGMVEIAASIEKNFENTDVSVQKSPPPVDIIIGNNTFMFTDCVIDTCNFTLSKAKAANVGTPLYIDFTVSISTREASRMINNENSNALISNITFGRDIAKKYNPKK